VKNTPNLLTALHMEGMRASCIGESHGWPLKCWNGDFVDWAGSRRPSSWILARLSHERMQADRRRAYQGRALIMVRSRRESGRIAVQAAAEGLEAAEMSLEVR
jgi:hypothetical protein